MDKTNLKDETYINRRIYDKCGNVVNFIYVGRFYNCTANGYAAKNDIISKFSTYL